MTPACYTCKHCNMNGHLAKDCAELRDQGGNGDGASSSADFLLMDNSEDEEEEGGSGFNDIRMIFDDDTDEEEEEENTSRNFDEDPVDLGNQSEDPNNENNLNMQRCALPAIMQPGFYCFGFWNFHFACVTICETLQGSDRGRSNNFGE